MSALLISRLAGMASAIVLVACIPRGDYIRLYSAVLLTHYALAAYYSRGRFRSVFERAPRGRAKLLFLGLASAAMVWVDWHLWMHAFFGLHLALNDVYLRPADADPESWESLVPARFAFSLAAIVFVFRRGLGVPGIVVFALFVLATVYFIFVFFAAGNRLSKRVRISVFVFESVWLLPVLLSVWHPLGLVELVSYHIFFWIVYPCLQGAKGIGGVSRARYLSQQAVGIGFLLTVSYAGGVSIGVLNDPGGYFHITSTFAVSSMNPLWIRALFLPESA